MRIVVCAFLALTSSSLLAADFTGDATYQRLFDEIKETGKPQPVIFTRGDGEAQQIAAFQSLLRSQGTDPLHVIDLEQCSEDLRKKWTQATDESYAMVLHPPAEGSYDYGPTFYRVAHFQSHEQYVSWVASNQEAKSKASYGYACSGGRCGPLKALGRLLCGRRRCR